MSQFAKTTTVPIERTRAEIEITLKRYGATAFGYMLRDGKAVIGFEHVWLGVSVENQSYIDRIEILAPFPAIVRFISYEPALGPLDLSPVFRLLWQGRINWVIGGGESGPKARPADPQWFVKVKNQCKKFNVPYFHKQNGGSRKIDGAWGGRILDGVEYNQFPEVG